MFIQSDNGGDHMNKKARLFVSVLWFVLMSTLLITIAISLKFPTFDNERYGYIIIPISIIVPIISFIYGVNAYKSEKYNKTIDMLILIGFILGIVYVFVCTFGFRLPSTVFYPLSSTTSDPENYLVIEDNLAESEYEYINDVFPIEIPVEAENVEYCYSCNSFWNYKIESKWNLPHLMYFNYKNEVMAKTNGYYTIQNDKSVFEFEFNTSSYKAKIEFDDKNLTVKYEFKSFF